MSNPSYFKIGNFQLKLTGDKTKILESAEEVNSQLKILSDSKYDLKQSDLPIMAALNLAEQGILNKDKHNSNINFVLEEVNKMAEHIKNSINIK